MHACYNQFNVNILASSGSDQGLSLQRSHQCKRNCWGLLLVSISPLPSCAGYEFGAWRFGTGNEVWTLKRAGLWSWDGIEFGSILKRCPLSGKWYMSSMDVSGSCCGYPWPNGSHKLGIMKRSVGNATSRSTRASNLSTTFGSSPRRG